MKATEEAFGLGSLLTLLLPGLLVAVALLQFADPTGEEAKALAEFANKVEFLATFLMFATFALLGAIVATLQAGLETWILDRVSAKAVGLTIDEYRAEWFGYLKSLSEQGSNPYISRLVLFFQFETRLGLAGMLVGASLCGRSTGLSFIAILVSTLMYAMGIYHHYELSEYRHKNNAQ